ncbi:MAG: pyrroloquinoline quinone-dependent dehydrogenase [Pseudomonadota bacterium]|nr:pyrroloquinoline quinone-dependent dehydrogenase [Pseudomonadota bacterium]
MYKFFLFFSFILFSSSSFAQNDDWSAYGKDSGGGHYSKATEITIDNVKNLEEIWTHRSGDYHQGNNWTEDVAPNSGQQTSFQATPLLVNETLYYCTPYNRIFALDSETGEEKWVFDPKIDIEGKGILHCRGVSSWIDKEKSETEECYHQIITGTIDAELFALDGKTGKLCKNFGDKGKVDLRSGLGDHDPAFYYINSPPAIINNLIVTGGSIADNVSTTVPGGVVRAYNARTGELIWYWDPIPPNQEPVLDDSGNQLYQRGTTNVWSIISADPELNLVYLPTGNTAADNYGGHRQGLDYYSSSVVALNASTGEVVWHFQTVYHDIWDYDVPSQPTFYDVEKDGKTIKALAQTTKMGLVFLLNRETGEPIFPIEEREVPQGAVEGDYVTKTQPFPTKPAPLTPTYLDPDDVFGFTPWDRGYCKRATQDLRNEGLYTPPSLQGSVHYPSAIGGANWGGPAIDSSRNILIANTMNLSSTIVMIPRDECNTAIENSKKSNNKEIVEGAIGALARDSVQARFSGLQGNEGTPYCTLRAYGFMSQLGVPCTKPPWGNLTAIDLNTGEHLWQIPLGTSKDLAPFPFWWIKGAPNIGGPTVTASGVTFIAATSDYYLRAFNTETGEELAKFRLPTGGHATPMTYTNKDGRQFVVIAAGGHWAVGSPASDHLIAYALPEK